MHRTINDWRLCLQTATTGHKHHTYCTYNTHMHTHLTDLFLGLPRWAGIRKVKPIGSKRQWVAVESAGPYASLHLAPDNHASTPPAWEVFLQTRCPSCRPTNSAKALKVHHTLYRTTLLRGTHSEQSANCNDMEKSAWILPEKLSQFQHKTASL